MKEVRRFYKEVVEAVCEELELDPVAAFSTNRERCVDARGLIVCLLAKRIPDGLKREGAHWTKEQVMDATNGMKFREGVTDWDRYVAFNAGYADFCRVLTDELVLRASHAFYFADEDAPENKVWIYMRCMQQR